MMISEVEDWLSQTIKFQVPASYQNDTDSIQALIGSSSTFGSIP